MSPSASKQNGKMNLSRAGYAVAGCGSLQSGASLAAGSITTFCVASGLSSSSSPALKVKLSAPEAPWLAV